MSLETLRADERYGDCHRTLARLELHIADPAFGSVVDKRIAVYEQMTSLALEHGWDPATQAYEELS